MRLAKEKVPYAPNWGYLGGPEPQEGEGQILRNRVRFA